jgi:hypothetical protein
MEDRPEVVGNRRENKISQILSVAADKESISVCGEDMRTEWLKRERPHPT